AENENLTVLAHAARLPNEQDKLAQRCTNLQDFVDMYRGVLSVLHRLPNEILLEIFQQTFSHVDKLNLFNNVSCIVGRVCRHWRAVALASPGFWCHFFV
ncbi:hypothetical protein C8F04DRAFT_881535, partial [Mycena alexandri]